MGSSSGLEPSVLEATRALEDEEAERNRVDYDLDGHPLPKVAEDPWGEGRPPVHP